MNIRESMIFRTDKPAILPIYKSDKINLFAVGLQKDQILARHTTKIPTLLTVLHGRITFAINGQSFALNTLDTYAIPVDTEHEVTGLEESIFTLMQEK